MRRFFLAFPLFASFALGATPLDVPPAPAEGKIENLVTVVAPEVRCAAVCEHAGWLALGHRAKHTEAQLSLFRLDDEGRVSPTPIHLKLPKPDALAKYPHQVLGVSFHPKLPLLYVWQDLLLPRNPATNWPADLTGDELTAALQFDHLVIVSMEKGAPEILTSLCRGNDYIYSRPTGSISADPQGERLYVPNLRGHKDVNTRVTVGRFSLAPDGIPLVDDADPKAERAARLTALHTLKTAGKPQLPQRVAPWTNETFPEVFGGAGNGFVHVGPDRVLFGSLHSTALVSWTPEEKQVKMFSYLVHDGYRTFQAAGHPTKEVAYVSAVGHQYALRFEHVEGNLSPVPQQVNFKDAYLTSPPAVMAKANRVAFAAANKVFAVSIDASGKFKAERVQSAIVNPSPEALVYSDKFDSLYVTVEKGK